MGVVVVLRLTRSRRQIVLSVGAKVIIYMPLGDSPHASAYEDPPTGTDHINRVSDHIIPRKLVRVDVGRSTLEHECHLCGIA